MFLDSKVLKKCCFYRYT